jgi:uncharacterized membrane protein YeaQ/YmgE (transglycosylase-associated protein family)
MVAALTGGQIVEGQSPARCSSGFGHSREDRMLTDLIWWVVVGLIAGWAAGKIMRGGGYGVAMDIVLGIVGAVVGGWLLGALGFHAYGLIGSIVVAIIGATFLIWLTRLLKKA